MCSNAALAVAPSAEQLESTYWACGSKWECQWLANKQLYRWDYEETPYGRFMVEISIVGETGTMRVEALNALAFFLLRSALSVLMAPWVSSLIGTAY